MRASESKPEEHAGDAVAEASGGVSATARADPDVSLKQLNVREQQTLIDTLTDWRVQPNGTEGYRTAEVTLGGVDTHELSSRTMEARKVPGLYFIGEVMDVTGWLGVQLPVGVVQRPGMRAGFGCCPRTIKLYTKH